MKKKYTRILLSLIVTTMMIPMYSTILDAYSIVQGYLSTGGNYGGQWGYYRARNPGRGQYSTNADIYQFASITVEAYSNQYGTWSKNSASRLNKSYVEIVVLSNRGAQHYYTGGQGY